MTLYARYWINVEFEADGVLKHKDSITRGIHADGGQLVEPESHFKTLAETLGDSCN